MEKAAILPLPAMKGFGRGFGVYNMACQQCGWLWVAVATVGAQGCQCPRCNVVDSGWIWLGAPNELPNDGCWLTPSLYGDF